jgi:hypothetical protein
MQSVESIRQGGSPVKAAFQNPFPDPGGEFQQDKGVDISH